MSAEVASAPPYAEKAPHNHDILPSFPPPSYPTSLPRSFSVGRQTVRPLVTTDELTAHLRLLGAFNKLEEQVRSIAHVDLPSLSAKEEEPSEDPEDSAWALYVSRAVHRFFDWSQNCLVPVVGLDIETLPEYLIPPLDVLMVWHAYMLNPRNYYEDSLRESLYFQGIHRFPLHEAALLIDSHSLLASPPSEERLHAWTSGCKDRTESFELALNVMEDSRSRKFILSCPMCSELVKVAWVKDRGTGYAQTNFAAMCPTCNTVFDRQTMRVRRLSDQLYLASRPKSDYFLAGSLLHPSKGTIDSATAKLLTERVCASLGDAPKRSESPEALAATLIKMKWSSVERAITGPTPSGRNSPKRLRRVLNCYETAYPASVELIGAVMRQGSFVKKMVQLGWTHGQRFSGSAGPHGTAHVLVRSIARYHAFLDLMSSGALLLVPTIDIDLAWHTHQLKSRAYFNDTLKLLQRTPDHDDKIDENALSTAYNVTARTWRDRFGVPYSVCGCAPLESKISERISNFMSKFKGNSSESSSAPPRAIQNPRPDLVSIEDEDADATHPSEHNSVVVIRHPVSEGQRLKRQKKIQKQAEELEKNVAKGRFADDWDRLRAQRAMDRNRNAHDSVAFAAMTPYWGIYPYGFYGAGYGGGIVDGSVGGCAAGTAGGSCGAGGCGTGASCGGGAGGGCGGGGGGGGCGGGGGGCGGGGC